MNLTNYIFLIPLLIALILVIHSMLNKTIRDIKQFRIEGRKQSNFEIFNEILEKINIFTPKKGSRLSCYYEGFLKYSRIAVKDLFKVKLIIFVLALLIILGIKYTNISITTDSIVSKFDYYTDLLYQYKEKVEDEKGALKQELQYLDIALNEISKNELLKSKKEDIQEKIKGYIRLSEDELLLPKETVANKVYYRLFDYYQCRQLNLPIYLLLAIAFTFIPEVLVFVYNFFARADARREMRFLKKLIIVNGSIKPVDFMEVLEVLIDKAHHHKKLLEEVLDANKRNRIDNKSIYQAYISSAKDLDTKLFYEKLDQANNYDFDQAILNIQNEFKLEKREQARKIKKRIDMINILGIMLFMVLIVIMIMYLLVPWMQSYNMSQLM